ncbi:aspartoacylase [Photobacterium sanctipauli]|uniref:Aspartoacylase n=1 Tax=Photobacterium sanctipauli TaxID=1342794 RepID=A0A2T3NWF5_9GAMM|nr:aspartoacylase [Photobacterium sanctipauli]PSW20624.1 aspartoacylase [Photobacterium sanctipauli]
MTTRTNTIDTVAIVGGTHGNEFSGIYLLRKWQQTPSLVSRDTFQTETVFANPKAFEANKRYLDCDMNRQFSLEDLANNDLANYEQSRAKALNAQLGPKGDAKTDFIIDLHNTTSNMGPSLILLQSDAFNRQMGAYVKMKMPDAVVVLEDQVTVEEHYFLSSISEQGVIVEIGPQPQSVIRQDILDWMDEMTAHILDFVDLHNQGRLPELPASYEAFKYHETLKLPEDENGERIGMVHRNVQDADFKPLKSGDPIFTLFDGTEVSWEGDYEAYPHFINEAAYYDNNLAMSLAKKVTVEV